MTLGTADKSAASERESLGVASFLERSHLHRGEKANEELVRVLLPVRFEGAIYALEIPHED